MNDKINNITVEGVALVNIAHACKKTYQQKHISIFLLIKSLIAET